MFDEVFAFVRVLAAAVSDRGDPFILHDSAGIGSLSGTTGNDDGEQFRGQDVFGPLGQVARPLPPDGVDGVDAIGARRADGLVEFGWRDARLSRKLPNGVKDGDVAWVGYGHDFVKLGVDGTVSVVTTDDGTFAGRLIYAQVRRDGFRWVGPFGKMTLDQTGFHMLHYSGARIDMGGVGGLPSPLDTLASYATISAALVQIQASGIALGPTDGVPQTVAKSAAILTAFGLTATALTAIQAALVALGGGGGSAAPVGAAVLGLTVTAAAAVPSQAVSVT